MKTKRLFRVAMIGIATLFSINLTYAYYHISPYAYCVNNPLKYVDPDGRTIRVSDYVNNQRIDYEWKQYQGNWGFYNSDNTIYAGNNTFIVQLSGALTGLMQGGDAGHNLVKGIADHSNVVTMWQRNRSATSGNDLGWNPTGIRNDGSKEQVPTTSGMDSNPMITLGHELAHIEYNWSGQNTSTWFNMTVEDKNGNSMQRSIPTSEIYTTHLENRLRSENKLPLRTFYGVDPSGVGIGPRIIVPSTRTSVYYNSQGVTNYKPLKKRIIPFTY